MCDVPAEPEGRVDDLNVTIEISTIIATEWTMRSSNPGKGKILYIILFSKSPCRPRGPYSFLFIWHQGSLQGVKRQELDVDHLFPSNAEVKSCTSVSSICLHGMDRDNCTFFYLL